MPKEEEPYATLLVAPFSVTASWQLQISKFIEEGHLNVKTYLGKDCQRILNCIKRKDDVDVLRDVDMLNA
jgi:hypothetical protein